MHSISLRPKRHADAVGEGSTRILVVEDSAARANTLAAVLDVESFDVTVVSSAPQALALVGRQPIDVIVLGATVPESASYEMCRAIKSSPATQTIPVVVLSPLSDPIDILRGLEWGADDVIAWPYDPTRLVSRIRSVLERDPRPRGGGGESGIHYRGRKFMLHAGRAQLLDLLVSTFDDVVRTQRELQESQEALREAYRDREFGRGPQLVPVPVEPAALAVREPVDLSELGRRIIDDLRRASPERVVDVTIDDGMIVSGDASLLEVLLENLLANAWKFTAKTKNAAIAFGSRRGNGEVTYFVRDNGAGFDMSQAGRLFNSFQRLHADDEFEGAGLGLAAARRVLTLHRGCIWADSEPGEGATFNFMLS